MPLGYDSRLTSTLITGLMAAARRGDVAAVRALLSRGASVHLKDRYVVVEGRIVWGVCAEGRVCGAAWRAVKVVVLGVVWGFVCAEGRVWGVCTALRPFCPSFDFSSLTPCPSSSCRHDNDALAHVRLNIIEYKRRHHEGLNALDASSLSNPENQGWMKMSKDFIDSLETCR
jgi:hypothetical protein